MTLAPWRFSLSLSLVLGAATAQAANRISTGADRKEVSITVYNDGTGLVREVRDLDLGQGRVALEFRDVAAQIQPETVSIRALSGADALRVFEQDYRYDLLSPETLLAKYVGRALKVHRWNERLGKDETFDAELLSMNGSQPVLRLNGEITYGFPGRFSFPEVPQNLIARPTLVWSLDSKQARQRVEATYLTGGLGWKSDYVLVLDASETKADLQGWVTLSNSSGASYEGARLQLVAGDVHRVRTRWAGGEDDRESKYKEEEKSDKDAFAEEALFEYHLYTLGRPTDVLQSEQKQVSLLEAKGIGVQKKLIFFGEQYWYRGRYRDALSSQKVGVFLDVENKEQNKLGMPLPKGVVRVYAADASGNRQFVGEDAIDHTPRDEKVRIKLGEAFDVVGERKQTSWTPFGTCTSESEWEISLRNHKDVPISVEDVEPIGGDWEVLSSSLPYTKKDAFTFTFDVKIPAKGETKVKYRARVKWC